MNSAKLAVTLLVVILLELALIRWEYYARGF